MNEAYFFRLRSAFRHTVYSILVSLSVVLTGCVHDPAYYGPPAHTHYYPHYYDYYFYPSVQVYFHFTTGLYYYLDDGIWISSRILPPYIHITDKDRVRIRIESDKPYLKFPAHKRLYKPRPDYREDKERSKNEREANKRWFQEYQKKQDEQKKKPRDAMPRGRR